MWKVVFLLGCSTWMTLYLKRKMESLSHPGQIYEGVYLPLEDQEDPNWQMVRVDRGFTHENWWQGRGISWWPSYWQVPQPTLRLQDSQQQIHEFSRLSPSHEIVTDQITQTQILISNQKDYINQLVHQPVQYDAAHFYQVHHTQLIPETPIAVLVDTEQRILAVGTPQYLRKITSGWYRSLPYFLGITLSTLGTGILIVGEHLVRRRWGVYL